MRRPALDTPFRPIAGTRGGQRQTLLGALLRSGLGWPYPFEQRAVESSDGARLLLRCSWQADRVGERPALLLVHGLGGSDASGYVHATGRLAWRRGWSVVRFNMRGAGAGEPLCPLLYNAGLDRDLESVLAWLAGRVSRIGMVGFSLGANMMLLGLARRTLPEALAASVAISPPLDLAACCAALERPSNRPYQFHFVHGLRGAYRRRQRRRPDLFAVGRECEASTVRQFDALITAPYGGYRDVDDYYASASAGPRLGEIDRHALIVCAADDPMIPESSVLRWPLPAHGRVRLELLPTGGHVGFVAATRAPGWFWAAERALGYLEGWVGDAE